MEYLREHLRQVSRAIKAGIPLKAYMHWSIIDTNELYSGGYTMMFGLTQVRYDKPDKERVRRDSWYYYQKVIKDGSVN